MNSHYMRRTKRTTSSLKKKHVVIVGVGALGSAASVLLARIGIGKLTLIDRDCVEAENLRHQNLYTLGDVGESKASAAVRHLRKINPDIRYVSFVADLIAENSSLLQSDLILDGTDNFQTRFLINEFSHKHKIPWIYAAGLRDEGYVHAYVPEMGSCFACIFGEAYGLESCETSGILPTTISMIASLQIHEALKILSGKKPEEALLHCKLSDDAPERLSLPNKKDCVICQQELYPYLSGKKEMSLVRLCGTGAYQLRVRNLDLIQLEKKLQWIGDVKTFSAGLHFQQLTIFSDGRILIKAQTLTEAKKICARYIGV